MTSYQGLWPAQRICFLFIHTANVTRAGVGMLKLAHSVRPIALSQHIVDFVVAGPNRISSVLPYPPLHYT